MFKGKETARPASNGGLNSILGDGSAMSGTLRIQGSLRVDGGLEGRLFASDAVVIGRTGVVRADIEAREIIVSGRVEGRLQASERVELQAGARVIGDVQARSLIIAEGVTFNGGCAMGGDAGDGDPEADFDEIGRDGEMTPRQLAVVESGSATTR